MTRTISFIIGIAVVAVVAVPAAFGNAGPSVFEHGQGGRPTGSSEQVDPVTFFHATQARLVQSPTIGIVRDNGYATQANLVESPTIGIVRDNGYATQAKLSSLSGAANPDAGSSGPSVTGVESSSGRDLNWPQIGIGFGIGILLAIVLGLSLKATRPRTLAH
jgi:hypothetical protein